MKAFAELYAALDATTKTSVKVDALARYFASASAVGTQTCRCGSHWHQSQSSRVSRLRQRAMRTSLGACQVAIGATTASTVIQIPRRTERSAHVQDDGGVHDTRAPGIVD